MSPIEAGQNLLHYRLIEQIGEGGMGVVWKALDETLDREVAIKILPAEFSREHERLTRFDREAKLLASLNHPNVAVVHGLHADQGVHFLVMELVDGEDLAKALARGPLPLREALSIGRQVAEALEVAHDHGVIHRDLKPANIQVTPEGKAKVLDFGLAKAFGPEPASGDPSLSPTITTTGTVAGVMLGTAAYMSPEQARGKAVDRRTDVWAFGCLLFEMLTGRRAFAGDSVADILAAVVNQKPDWNALPAAAGARTERLLRRCLKKDPSGRMRDMGDLALVLEEIESERVGRPVAPATEEAARRGWLWPTMSGLLLLALLVAVGTRWLAPDGGDTRQGGAGVEMLQLTDLPGYQHSPSLSPDGRMLLYVTKDGGDADIFLQRVGGENPINLTEDHPDDDFDPAFSPDGERIAFSSRREGGGVFVMGATGENPQRISDEGFHPAWSPDGRRLLYTTEHVWDAYSRSALARLWVVDVESREKKLLFDGDAAGPQWSPSGRRIAYWSYWVEIQGQRDIWTVSAEGGAPVAVTEDAHTDWGPLWSPDGRWLYFLSDRGGSPDLWRVRIDESSGRVLGDPQAVTTGIARVTEASASADGRRVAVTAGRESGEILRVGFDPASERLLGQPLLLHSSSNAFDGLDVSPDGRWLVYTAAPGENLRVMRIDGGGRRQLTDDGHRNRGPKWSPDGRWITFFSNRTGAYEVWAVRPDGTNLRRLSEAPDWDANVPIWSPDGRRIALAVMESDGTMWIGVFEIGEGGLDSAEGPYDIERLAGSEDFFPESWSPDGRLLSGFAQDRQGQWIFGVYSFEAGGYEVLRDAEGHYYWSEWVSTWLDGHRLLFWDDQQDTTVLWDADLREAREVPGIPGPATFNFTNGGRTLIINRTVIESDIWLLALGE